MINKQAYISWLAAEEIKLSWLIWGTGPMELKTKGPNIQNIIGYYNPSSRIIDRVSHTTYVMYVHFIHKWRDLQFKVASERQIFWETSHGNFFIYSEFLSEICWEEIAKKNYFLYFVLMSGLRLET